MNSFPSRKDLEAADESLDGRRKGRRGLKRAEMRTKAGRDVCTEADAQVGKQIAADTEQVVWGAQRAP